MPARSTANASNDLFVLNIGQGDGDTVLDFNGYGSRATFTNIDASIDAALLNVMTSCDVPPP